MQNHIAPFSDITLLKQQQQLLEHKAHFDALTNLPNRLLLADRLRQAMRQASRRRSQLAVAYLDLDGFKPENECPVTAGLGVSFWAEA
jgi:GGDEF domain-containing protein